MYVQFGFERKKKQVNCSFLGGVLMFVIRTKLGGSRSLREDYSYEINRGAYSVSWRGLCARVKWRGSFSHASYEVLARGVVDSSL